MAAPTKKEAVAELQHGHQRMNELFGKLSADQFAKPAKIGGGEWSAKDLMGHMALWEEIALLTIESWVDGQPAPLEETFGSAEVDAINARNEERKKAWPAEQVRTDSLRTHQRLLSALDGLTEQQWQSVLPFGPEGKDRTLGEELGGVLGAPGKPFGHWSAHLPDLDAYVGSANQA